MPLLLYNTKTRKKETFKPIRNKSVGLYSCGPTVYQYPHLGNLRSYIFVDILKRVLALNGYKITHIMNITDVGHLVSDADTGEDKVEKEAKKEHKTAWQVAKFYEKIFKDNLKELNISPAARYPRASEHIKEQIDFIKGLEKKGYTYKTSDGIYFDTSKFKNYGILLKTKPKNQKTSRKIIKSVKRHPSDFALWKFSPKNAKRDMEWQSPWGVGFPGWHLECSAMSVKYLGKTLDIHTGGVDHIPVHHTNEIAQSESLTGKKFVNFWLHSNFLLMGKEKMAKSKGTFITLRDIKDKHFNPLDFRYLVLTSHYRSPLLFSWDALGASKTARENIEKIIQKIFQLKKLIPSFQKVKNGEAEKFKKEFKSAVNDDLNIPRSLSLFWNFLDKYQGFEGKNRILDPAEVLKAIYFADEVFGLNLKKIKPLKISNKLKDSLDKREKLRKAKKFQDADKIRSSLAKEGFLIEDTVFGPIVYRA